MMRFLFTNILMFIFSLNLVLAQGPGGNSDVGGAPTGSSFPNPIQATSITALFAALLEILVIFAMPIVAFFIIYAGFLYVTARGNVETVTRAHRALLYAVIGGVIVLGGSVLIEVIQGTVESVKSTN